MWRPPLIPSDFDRRRFVLALEDGSALVLDEGERLRLEGKTTNWQRVGAPETNWQPVSNPETSWT